MMPGADPFGPRFTHHHSEGQPPFRLLPGGRPITASSTTLALSFDVTKFSCGNEDIGLVGLAV
jgi:hypothetical protein